jgi:hypothetical protein
LSVAFVKAAMDYSKNKFDQQTFETYIKVMADFSLAIALKVEANPVVCMTASILHKIADGVTGDFRANLINPILRDIGFDANSINIINSCIDNLLPENKNLRQSKEEKVVGDAYILTYWNEIENIKVPYLEFEESEKLLHKTDT